MPSSVIDLVTVTGPNPPLSSALMMPPTAVLVIAPAHVLHGAVREHGLASSPTPDTQVRVACAKAGGAATAMSAVATMVRTLVVAVRRRAAMRMGGIVAARGRTRAGPAEPTTLVQTGQRASSTITS